MPESCDLTDEIVPGSHVSPAALYLVAARVECSCIGSATADSWAPTAHSRRLRSRPMEVAMERFIHNANIDLYRRLIAESERNPKRDEDRHKLLQILLDEETAKDKKPLG
jgi:hypothetical protein